MRWAALAFAVVLAGCAIGEAQGEPESPTPASEPARVVAQPVSPPPPASPPLAPGWFAEATLESAAFVTPGSPSVVVHAPPGFDPSRPLHLVVFIHGWRGCARQLAHGGEVACRDGARPVSGWDLAARFDEAGLNALFVVPQLAFLVTDGSAGRFVEAGRFRAFVEEMLGALRDRLGPPTDASRIASVTLLAHSAGYETTLALLARGGVEVDEVVLFDAMYRGHNAFADWVLGDPDRRFVSLHGATGRTVSQSQLFAGRLRSLGEALSDDAEGDLESLVEEHRVVIARASAPHGDIPARHMAEVLRGLRGSGPAE
ncbi:MAG: hypothetical protein KC619_04150 [Myxococcales bacterium]|nr:hypothetical protein [Myxococcales bacterium]